MSLAWSFMWRVLILGFLFSFVSVPIVEFVLLNFNGVEQIHWRPSLAPWLLAAFVWGVSAASPAFFARLLWGDRLRLSVVAWTFAARAIAIFFVLFGLGNILAAKLAPMHVWVNFKLFAFLPLYIAFMLWLGWRVRREQVA